MNVCRLYKWQIILIFKVLSDFGRYRSQPLFCLTEIKIRNNLTWIHSYEINKNLAVTAL